MRSETSILELRSRSDEGIYAIPYLSGRRRKAQRLLDGMIVERPSPEERRHAPDRPAACFEVAAGGGAATIHHANLGLIAALLPLEDVYLLPSGEVAAVYGAEAVPISGVPDAKIGDESSHWA